MSGSALQILQRRLASSPAAIYQSLKRRRERLERELAEAKLAAKGRGGAFWRCSGDRRDPCRTSMSTHRRRLKILRI